MGGEGSGRHPSIETIIKRSQPELIPIGDSLFLPNYSGVQKAALKTEAPLGTGESGDPSVWQSGSGVIYYNDGNVGIGQSIPTESLEIKSTSPAIKLEDSSTTGYALISSNNANSLIISADDTNVQTGTGVVIESDGSEVARFRFASGAPLVGIGTTSPARPLHIQANNTFLRADRIDATAGASWLLTRMTNITTVVASWFFGIGKGIAGVTEDDFNIIDYGTAVTGTVGTNRLQIRKSDGAMLIPNDDQNLIFGSGQDASLSYNGTNLIINPKLSGSGIVNVLGNISGSSLIGNNLKIYQGVRWIKPYHYAIGATSQTFTAGRVLLTEFEVLNDCTADAISYTSVGTLSGSVIVGIYGPIGTEETCSGSSLIVQQSHTPTTTNSAQLISISGSSLVKGRYYLALEGEDASNTYTRESNVEKVEGWGQFYARAGGYGELTNPCPAITNTSSAIPGMLVRCSS